MNLRTILVPGLLACASLCCARSCKAQEVDPDHFTLTGVETYPEKGARALQTNKKNQPAPDAKQANLDQPVLRGQKTRPTPQAVPAKLVQPVVREQKTPRGSDKKSTTPAPSN